MAEEEEWERPIGLTAECAICLDDSDDDGESPASGVNRGIPDDDQLKVESKCISSLSHENESMIGNATSSYFKKVLNGNCNRVASKSDSDRGDQNNVNGIMPTVDENESTKTIDNTVMAKDYSSNGSKSSINEEDAFEETNPFASFSFRAEETSSSSSSWRPEKRPRENRSNNKPSHQPMREKENSTKVAKQQRKKEKQTHSFSSNITTKSTINTGPKAVHSLQMTQSEQADIQQKKKSERKQHRQETIAKWHAFAEPNVSIEQRRFQVLIAARLHARCHEKTVIKAMDQLRKYFHEKDSLAGNCCDVDAQSEQRTRYPTPQSVTESATKPQPRRTPMEESSHHAQGLTVHSLAKSTPETEIAPLLSSVLFGNTKANQIVRAAQDVIAKFGGTVPESNIGLKEITGIGPKLAEILSIVNRRETFS